MKHPLLFAAVAAITLGSATLLGQDQEPKPPLGFFVTSSVQSGDLGGLAGANRHPIVS